MFCLLKDLTIATAAFIDAGRSIEISNSEKFRNSAGGWMTDSPYIQKLYGYYRDIKIRASAGTWGYCPMMGTQIDKNMENNMGTDLMVVCGD